MLLVMYIAGTCTSARQLTRESFGRYKVVKKCGE